MGARQGTFSVNGIQLAFEIRGAGEGEPLLLLHGFLGAGGDWAHVFDLDQLARRRTVISPDLRGHGRTDNPAGTFTHGQCADDVAALLDHLGVARCQAIGLSLGGGVLLHLATRSPSRLTAMAIVSAPPRFPEPARAFMRQTRAPEAAAEWEALRQKHVRGDDQIRALFAHARAFADSHDDMAFSAASLAKIEARTLIVYGDRDPLYPVDLAVEMYRAIPGAALWVVPGGGHGPIFGDQREAFVAGARQWFGWGAPV
jgi:pimeloyl-ACP methyl ester carboxylesterase